MPPGENDESEGRDERDRPVIETQVAFKGDFDEDEQGDE